MNFTASRQSVCVIRWLARALGLAFAGLHGVFFFGHLGEFFDMQSPPPIAAWSTMILLLVIMSGYILAWKFEVSGAIMVISGAILLFSRTGMMFPVYAGIVSLPAGMHLYCHFAKLRNNNETDRPTTHKRIIMNAAVAVPLTIAGLFVLELFTHHATPYTEKNLPEDLVGTWSGTGVVRVIPETDEQIRVPVTLTVHDNGSVSGTIGNATVRNLTAQKNRWWLYRKIGFYTDHLIEGRLKGDIESDDGLSGELVRMPCNIKDGKLCGTIFHMNGLKYNPIVNRLALSRESSGDVEEP